MNRLRRSFNTAVFLALGVCFSLTFLIVSELAQRRLADATQDFARSLEARSLLREIGAAISEAEAAHRGYFLSGRQEYLQTWQTIPDKLNNLQSRLHELWADDPERLALLRPINAGVEARLRGLRDNLARYRPGQPASVRAGLGQEETARLKQQLQIVLGKENQRYQTGMAQWKADASLTRMGIGILTVVNLVLLVLLYSRAQQELRRKEIEDTTNEARQHELERLVEERTAVLSELSSDLQIEQEREKAKIAHDIHDELGSLVISARMDVTYVLFKLRKLDTVLAEKLERAIQSLDASVDIKRRIIEELRPSALDTLGLAPAIEWQVQQVCERAGLTARLDLPEEMHEPSEQVAIALFRITQEALTNIVKYAKATDVAVTLDANPDGGYQLTIRDNGIGLTDDAINSPLSHGIAGMRQRVVGLRGSFSITSTPGSGTTIMVEVPAQATSAMAMVSDQPA
ncbi:sensor histidine kinase [Chitinimonas lacunae]|uniref:histidine kinase n=1 Tax=Chitinimonas lacunae TaxID=1963018 RepID=A0ABV8MJQ8_9NEIS